MATSPEEIRKGGGAYAVALLKQARRCEEVVRRLELLNIHGGDDKAEMYIMLNTNTLEQIEQMAVVKMEGATMVAVAPGASEAVAEAAPTVATRTAIARDTMYQQTKSLAR